MHFIFVGADSGSVDANNLTYILADGQILERLREEDNRDEIRNTIGNFVGRVRNFESADVLVILVEGLVGECGVKNHPIHVDGSRTDFKLIEVSVGIITLSGLLGDLFSRLWGFGCNFHC